MRLFIIFLLAHLSFCAFGVEPNFVEAYLMVAEPGGELYSCAGHTALRLKCDTHKLDYCYSYESEMVSERVLTFLSGNLKMGMFAVPTQTYLSFYRDDRRGVRQYPLNLPIEVKRQLWKVMDGKISEGVTLPYDYLERGCAQSVLNSLKEAVRPLTIDFGKWPAKFGEKTRRELFYESLNDFPWNRFFALTIGGTEVDEEVSKYRKVVIPNDLLEVLRNAKVAGEFIITEAGEEMVAGGEARGGGAWFSPMVASGIILVFAFLGMLRKGGGIFRGILYALYAAYAIFYTYLVFLSSLPATSWHWNIIPFNILPIVLWKWREKWRLFYAGISVAWMVGMAVYPHLLIDSAYYILVSAYVVLACTIRGGKA